MKMIYISHPYIGNEVENVKDAANKKPRETGQILRLSIFYGIAR